MTSSSTAKTIQVYLRIRPSTQQESSDGHTFTRIVFPEGTNDEVCLDLPHPAKARSSYVFSRVFRPEATQGDVYELFGAHAVAAALNGEHGVLLAYGQTGSGKTHSIASASGVAPRALEELWRRIGVNARTRRYEVRASVVEIYQRVIVDLSDPTNKTVLSFAQRDGSFRRVHNLAETMTLFQRGFACRQTSQTTMNATSSRSHFVLTVDVVQIPPEHETGSILHGRLMICDLAGSERLVKTQAIGAQRDEGIAINRSLLALGNAVSALVKGSEFVQFRDSVLTQLLEPALRGDGNTSILIAASPSDDNIRETSHAIEFGMRASSLTQTSTQKVVQDFKHLYDNAVRSIDSLKQQLEQRDQHIKRLDHQIFGLKVRAAAAAIAAPTVCSGKRSCATDADFRLCPTGPTVHDPESHSMMMLLILC